jgi:hypothetical protein
VEIQVTVHGKGKRRIALVKTAAVPLNSPLVPAGQKIETVTVDNGSRLYTLKNCKGF